jgi:hypothetical protein
MPMWQFNVSRLLYCFILLDSFYIVDSLYITLLSTGYPSTALRIYEGRSKKGPKPKGTKRFQRRKNIGATSNPERLDNA